jgi:hypothetical protein
VTLSDFEGFSLRDLMDPAHAQAYLGLLLNQRKLALLLGAGVSAGAGLPSWTELVQGCEAAVGLASSPDRSTQDLMRAIDTVRRQLNQQGRSGDLPDLIRENLYSEDYRTAGDYPTSIMQNPMLIAIGALVMASSRGSVGDVFTLNFDDLLEWYLHLHGFSTQVVVDFPTDLSGRVDVTIFHPHGFVPLLDTRYARSDWLVLSHTEFIQRLASGPDSPWPLLLSSRFLTKRFLAVGTSMEDIEVDVHLAKARTSVSGSGPLGFVVAAKMEEDRQEALLELGMVPVIVGRYEEVPPFLLAVCRSAV